MANNHFADDALVMNRQTTLGDIQGFIRDRTRSPRVIRDNNEKTIIWDYSPHEIDHEALEKANLHRSEYTIPFNIGSVWGLCMTLLPKRIQEAEILRYDVQEGVYVPYHSFNRDMTEGEVQDFRNSIEKIMKQSLSEV